VANWDQQEAIESRSCYERVPPSVVAALLIITAIGCEKHSSEAVVLAKEHIDAALPNAETPNMSRTGVQSTARPTGTQAESTSSPDVEIRPMADDEIDVDGYVMKPELRGTSRDPRALHHEQWLG
jgi:hypothetical protein